MQNSSFIDADLFKQIAEKNGFELVNPGAEILEEISGQAWVLKHVESGARLLFLENDDNNKAFSIAFKTPPANSTGVFHILEHSQDALVGGPRLLHPRLIDTVLGGG